jgi:ABC-type multidrug transport system ATPase subunit
VPAEALRARHLTKTYGDLVALAPLDLVVRPGERVVLVGHNGSGKTTLLRIAAGLLEPSSGDIEIAGAPAGSMEAREAVSLISDTPVFYDDLSVLEHMEYLARLHGNHDWREGAEWLVDRLGIAHRADDLPVQFSRGLKQKAAIALALVRPFEVLLVDEPFVGLDLAGKEALLGLLDEVSSSGDVTVIVATHQLEYAARADRCVALRDGEVVHDAAATPAEVEELVKP